MFIEIKDLEFKTVKEASENINYPESGFYMVESEGQSDLRFVDKTVKHSFLICPKSVMNGIFLHKKNPEAILAEPGFIENTTPPAGYVSESFVMDFTAMLFSKK
ncbi:hypothetical protein OZ664_19980 [Elizabethkingia sp. HX WHF]|uniref:hypothetical protein n=1 Tax=Elizabethkingia sp. HX WHF TaxID=3003190 RepID=UPI002A24E663|nr:hypothetical protein [Elizabethkingia sp. HX WHF]MDX8566298.1 hypothetical protein [Elizabethkingia sp. HX WHF]